LKLVLGNALTKGNKQDYRPVFYEPYIQDFQTKDSGEVNLHLFEKQPPSCDLGDRLDPLEYIGVDLVIMCFAFDSPDSLENLREKWIEQVLYHTNERRRAHRNTTTTTSTSNRRSWLGFGGREKRGPIPLIVVGCKSDLRENEEVERRLKSYGLSMIKQEEVNVSFVLLVQNLMMMFNR
jgi:GTPase SAR1 family protein